jgi:AraC-like DNA-binding protein
MRISGIALPDLHMQVVYFGSRKIDRDLHRHSSPAPYWVLHWNRTRTATIRFEGRLSRLGPDVLSLAAPRTVAEETMRLGEEHTYLHFMLGPRYDRVESRVLVLPAGDPIGRLLKNLSDSYRRKDRLDPRDEFGVHALIALVLQEIPLSFWPPPPRDPRIQTALEHLDERFGERITNPMLAASARLATNSFLRLFSEQVGEPPQRYLMRRRLEQAALMLAQTDQPIDKIAAACGFCNRNYFTVCFKRHYSRGPAAFRRAVAPADDA